MEENKLSSSQKSKYIIRVIREDDAFCMRVYKKYFSDTKTPIITKMLDCTSIEEAQEESKRRLPELLLVYKGHRKEKKKNKKEKKISEKKTPDYEEKNLIEMSFVDLLPSDESPTKVIFRKKLKSLKDGLLLEAFKQGLSERESQIYIKEKIGKNWDQTLGKASDGTLDKL